MNEMGSWKRTSDNLFYFSKSLIYSRMFVDSLNRHRIVVRDIPFVFVSFGKRDLVEKAQRTSLQETFRRKTFLGKVRHLRDVNKSGRKYNSLVNYKTCSQIFKDERNSDDDNDDCQRKSGLQMRALTIWIKIKSNNFALTLLWLRFTIQACLKPPLDGSTFSINNTSTWKWNWSNRK